MENSERTFWIEVFGFSFLSILLYQAGLFLVLFAIPIQVLYIRRGEEALLYGILVQIFGILLVSFLRFRNIQDGSLESNIFLLELYAPVIFSGGLFIVSSNRIKIKRRYYKFLFAAVLSGLVGIPYLMFLQKNQDLNDLILGQIQIINNLFAANGAEQVESGVGQIVLNPENTLEFAKSLFYSTYLFGYLILLGGSWMVGSLIGNRTMRSKRKVVNLRTFFIEEKNVWPLLFSWAIVLLSKIIDLGIIRYIVWNTGLIMLLLYGLQGIGILQFLINKKNVVKNRRLFLGLLIFFLILTPGINLVLFIGVPVLGVSEIWIKYRKT
jgi:hypothetical protein